MAVLFHRTTDAARAAILRDGFSDASGSYMMGQTTLTGVWLSDVPLALGEGCAGTATLRVALDVSDDELSRFEIVEDEKPYREWCVPAETIATRGRIEAMDEDEADEVRNAWLARVLAQEGGR